MKTYAITPGNGAVEEIVRRCRRLVAAGVDFIQIREKGITDRELFNLTTGIARITSESTTRLLVNDRLDIAQSASADGVHIGGTSLPPEQMRSQMPEGMVLAVSCHDLGELSQAEAAGADLATFSPVYPPRSKADSRPALGPDGVRRAVEGTDLPIFALGGISRGHLDELSDTGCTGVAAISLFFTDDDVEKTIERLQKVGE